MAKRFKIKFSPAADADLESIALWIAEQTGGFRTALHYTKRLRQFIDRLRQFPHRGTQRDDFITGLRVIGFERRVAIAFRIVEDDVVIVRIFYAGRDLDALAQEKTALPKGESGTDDET